MTLFARISSFFMQITASIVAIFVGPIIPKTISENTEEMDWHYYNEDADDNFNFGPTSFKEEKEIKRQYYRSLIEQSEFAQRIRKAYGDGVYYDIVTRAIETLLAEEEIEAEMPQPPTRSIFRARYYVNDKRRPQATALSHMKYRKQKIC